MTGEFDAGLTDQEASRVMANARPVTAPHTHGGTDAPECTTCKSQRPVVTAAERIQRINPYEFDQDELRSLANLGDHVTADVAYCNRRLVVEVWDSSDTRPIAWIEQHPSDSAPTIRFAAGGEGS